MLAHTIMEAIDEEVGRGSMFTAFQHVSQLLGKAWLAPDPWEAGLEQTMANLQLLKVNLIGTKITIEEMIVLQFALELPAALKWLQREIFDATPGVARPRYDLDRVALR